MLLFLYQRITFHNLLEYIFVDNLCVYSVAYCPIGHMIFQPKPPFADAFTDSAISAKVNGEHKEKDLEPWDAGELTTSEELEALENDVVSKIFELVSDYDHVMCDILSLGFNLSILLLLWVYKAVVLMYNRHVHTHTHSNTEKCFFGMLTTISVF